MHFMNLGLKIIKPCIETTELSIDTAELFIDRSKLCIDRAKLCIDRAKLCIETTELFIDSAELSIKPAFQTLNLILELIAHLPQHATGCREIVGPSGWNLNGTFFHDGV